MPSSPFTTRLGLALPIVQGPMTGSDTPALAAAVSQAGGLGMLGCGMRSPAPWPKPPPRCAAAPTGPLA